VAMDFTKEAGWTGGPAGMAVPRLVLLSTPVRGAEMWYWVSAVSFLIGATLAQNLIDSPSGRALAAIHDSELAARVLGVDAGAQKLKAFVISAVYASVAGSLFPLLNRHITPDVSRLPRSIQLLALV